MHAILKGRPPAACFLLFYRSLRGVGLVAGPAHAGHPRRGSIHGQMPTQPRWPRRVGGRSSANTGRCRVSSNAEERRKSQRNRGDLTSGPGKCPRQSDNGAAVPYREPGGPWPGASGICPGPSGPWPGASGPWHGPSGIWPGASGPWPGRRKTWPAGGVAWPEIGGMEPVGIKQLSPLPWLANRPA